MGETPPIFQEANRCAVCGAAFSTFRRRHHCRSCGKSLCNDHSSNQLMLPQFGIKTAVRVCDDCFLGTKQVNGEEVSKGTSIEQKAVDSLTRLDLSSDDTPISSKGLMSGVGVAQVQQCICGMPLCICQIPSASPAVQDVPVVTPVPFERFPAIPSKDSSTVKKISTRPSYGNDLPSLFFSNNSSTNHGAHTTRKEYESTGEGIREAIKNGDAAAVKDLLAAGVDPNHRDKQGMSLLHLAAVFNCTEIVFLLMDGGANVGAKNAQGETPLDCAPATLQYKMQQKLKHDSNNH